MKFGIIIRNVSDLRARPTFHSERTSQLLFNESVTVSARRKGYLKVTLADGYSGWVDEKAVCLVPDTIRPTTPRPVTHIVSAATARLIPEPGSSADVPFLFYGTRLTVRRKDNKRGIIKTPDGRSYGIALPKLTSLRDLKKQHPTVANILRSAKRFLGVPYLWGGKTPFGFDCSGFVQIVYDLAGISLPRDSKDQRKAGVPVAHAAITPGDLLFYPGHVAIAMSRQRIIHASLGEGGVAVNSLLPDTPGFRKDLYDSFQEARRVLS